MVQLQTDQVAGLRASHTTSWKVPGIDHVYKIPEVHSVVLDERTGETIDGLHRNRAGWKTKKKLRTFDDLEFYAWRLHATRQRAATQTEHAELFGLIAKELAKKMPEEDVGAFIRDHISPFERSYTYALIPNRYKKETSPRGERVRPSDSPAPPDVIKDSSGAQLVRSKDTVRRNPGEAACPSCRTMLKITSANTLALA